MQHFKLVNLWFRFLDVTNKLGALLRWYSSTSPVGISLDNQMAAEFFRILEKIRNKREDSNAIRFLRILEEFLEQTHRNYLAFFPKKILKNRLLHLFYRIVQFNYLFLLNYLIPVLVCPKYGITGYGVSRPGIQN